MIYLDNAATTFPKPQIFYDEIENAYKNYSFNSGRGAYKVAQEVSNVIEETRKKLSNLANGGEVIFTPSATSSLNQIIKGLEYNENVNVYITPFEHNSIVRPLNYIKQKYGFKVFVIPFNKETWELEENDLKDMFCKNKPTYVFASHVSNVTGYILPINKIIDFAKEYDAITVIDASQSFGTVDVNVIEDKIDYLVFAGHKSLYGPFGIAGYIKNNKNELKVTFSGGTGSDTLNKNMPEVGPGRYEAGSPNAPAIYLLNKSLNFIKETNVLEKKEKLTKYLIEKLNDLINVTMYLPQDITKCEGIVSLNVDNYTPEEVGNILNEEFGIAVRTGFHCAPLVHDFLDTTEKLGTVRISVSYFNTYEEIDKLVDALYSL